MTPARLLLLAGVAVLATAWAFDGTRPPAAALLPAVRADPLQAPSATSPFAVRAGGVDYRIEPVAEYDIAGLVVSRHDALTWWDQLHAEANDHLNVVDLCLAWGANASDGAYERMAFSSGQFTCYWSSATAVAPEHVRAVSNNHLLTADPAVARLLRSMRVGDQVRLRGQLASYAHDAGFAFRRGTSTLREDTGNGACETLFVRRAEVLRPGPGWPRALAWLGALLLAAGLVAWWRAPMTAGRE